MNSFDKYLVNGHVGGMTVSEIAEIVKSLCDAYGLDYRLKPFEIISFQGSAKIYFSKAGCDALAAKFKLSRMIKQFEIDKDLNGVCEIEITDGTRTETEYAFRFFGKKQPKQGGGVETVCLEGKELALEKMKLISSAKRRATLTFVGATLTTIEESYNEPAVANIEAQVEVQKDILPPVVVAPKEIVKEVIAEKPVETKKEVVKEVVEQIIEAPKEDPVVKEQIIDAPKEEITLDAAKAYIKEHFKTQKAFKEQTNGTPEQLFEYMKSNDTVTIEEFTAYLVEKNKPIEVMFSFDTAEHKTLICKEIDNLIGTQWKQDKAVITATVEKIKALGAFPMSEMNKKVKEMLGV